MISGLCRLIKWRAFGFRAMFQRSESRAMKDRKERRSTAEDIMKYHDDVASEEIIRETERHIKKIIEALKKA